MRLNARQRQAIRECVTDCDPSAKALLFGSRVHDDRRGGDIDLLVQSRKMDFRKRMRLKLALLDALGAQKIDIVVDDGRPSAFIRLARKEAIPL